MRSTYNGSMLDMSDNYAAPKLSETLTNLNTFGAVIIGSLYYVIVAITLIFAIHWVARRYLFPRLANKRFALIFILTLHALVLVAATLLVLNRFGFDVAVLARISILLVIITSAVIVAIEPHLPSLPFKIGDMVEIAGVTGNIRSISPVFTRIQLFNGRTAFIPTPTVWSKNIVNYHFTPTRRVELKLTVSADHSLDDARAVLLDIMNSEERVVNDPAPPAVRVEKATAEGVDLLGLCWVPNADFLKTRSDLYARVVAATQADTGISLALERQQVVLSGEVINR